MPFSIPADAPEWVFYAVWIFFAIFAGLFGAATPRLRSAMAKMSATPTQPEVAMRAVGAAVGGSLDFARVSEELERIAEALERVAAAAELLAKMEEQGTARTLTDIADKLRRLDERADQRRSGDR